MFGGKLGRHPRLAEELVDLAGEKELRDAFKVILRVFMEHGLNQERFAGMVERMGSEKVRRKIMDFAKPGNATTRISNISTANRPPTG